MDTVFVSYSFNPEGRQLSDFVKNVARTYSLRPLDGEALGGGALNDEIRTRIKESDSLVAVLTPRQREAANGEAVNLRPSTFVREELNYARTIEKPTIALVADGTELEPGLWDDYERIELTADNPFEGYLKLGRTLSGWRTRGGRMVQVLLSPPGLAERVGEANGGCRCSFRMTKRGRELRGWSEASVLPEAGGVCAYLSGVVEDALLQLKVELDGETWQSPALPQWVHVELKKRDN